MFRHNRILNEKYKILFSQIRLSEQENRQKNKAFCIKLQSAFFICSSHIIPYTKVPRGIENSNFSALWARLNKVPRTLPRRGLPALYPKVLKLLHKGCLRRENGFVFFVKKWVARGHIVFLKSTEKGWFFIKKDEF